MSIFRQLDDMRHLLRRRDWQRLETTFEWRCRFSAGLELTERISRLEFKVYEERLAAPLSHALAIAARDGMAALYFEYDLDNDWFSGFYFCRGYNPESARDDDWAAEFVADLAGPDFREANEIYRENAFGDMPTAIGAAAYLVARTVAAFARALDRHPRPRFPVCIAFHDQETVMRVYEPLTA